jgi:ascorbate-specific PTS system EIIC-type component UlaA
LLIGNGVVLLGLCTLVGLTALETALGKVLTGAGSAMGWLETGAGFGLLETGAGVVVPIGGAVTVGLEIVGLGFVVVVVAACGVLGVAGV